MQTAILEGEELKCFLFLSHQAFPLKPHSGTPMLWRVAKLRNGPGTTTQLLPDDTFCYSYCFDGATKYRRSSEDQPTKQSHEYDPEIC